MSCGSILVVCTGNICRSPVGAAVLARSLSSLPVKVESAGTHAEIGRPLAPQTADFIRRELGTVLDHKARQFEREDAHSVDLVVTMTAEHRAWVARTFPKVARHTFTLLELEKSLELLPSTGQVESVRQLALAASRMRARAKSARRSINIADPYGGPTAAYEKSFRLVSDASVNVARQISDRIILPKEGDRE